MNLGDFQPSQVWFTTTGDIVHMTWTFEMGRSVDVYCTRKNVNAYGMGRRLISADGLVLLSFLIAASAGVPYESG